MTKSGRLPDYVVRHLVAQGLRDGDTGAMRRARAAYCLRCHALVMRGIDAPFGGMSRDVEPAPLSRIGEALALMSGRRTYTLAWRGDRYEIDHRDQWQIRGSPAESRAGVDVVVEHDCDAPELPTGETRIAVPQPAGALPDQPPF